MAAVWSLALLRIRIWYPSVVIGVVTGAVTLLGIYLGNRLHGSFGNRMELAGGLVLIGIGVRILWMHCG